MDQIAENIARIGYQIAKAADRAGRDKGDITLVAVSKTVPQNAIREAFEGGQRTFGESYAQELRDKARDLADLGIEWHFIGHLQKNKAKYVAPIARMVESVDSIELADALDRRAVGRLDCLIELNVGGELSKAGANEKNLLDIARHIETLPNLRLRGLMTIPPYSSDPEASRPHFKNLREILNRMNDELGPDEPYSELSMGMSHDFGVAIEEGATIVRIGTAIFGQRS